jgi:PucR C-terminal helix-turn-helix domain
MAVAVERQERFGSEASAQEFMRLVAELETRLDFLAAEGLEAMRGRMPRWISETDAIWQQIGECIRGTLRTEWAAFRDGVLPGRLPDIDATMIVMAARVGDLNSLQAGYRFAQMALWGSWFELVEASVAAGPLKRELLRHGSQYFFQYADLVSRYMAEGYQRGIERAAASGEHHRFQAIKSLLEGDPLAHSHVDVDLNQHHLGLVVWGEGGDEAVRLLARELDRRALLTQRLHHNWWGWLSGTSPLDSHQERMLTGFNAGGGIRIAFGLEGYGEPGFRATNHQALRAQWVAPAGAATIHYEDVAVEALATEAQNDARAFVRRELRGIDDPSGSSDRLRQTLDAYLAAELNAASAAASLGVHHQTVANRLRTIEERLGHPVGPRHLELAMALRLWGCLAREGS